MQKIGQNVKTYCRASNIKMENNEFQIVRVKNRTCYYFDNMIKLEDFHFEIILIDEKSCEHTLIYDISCRTLIDAKPLCITFDKIDEFIRVYNGTKYLLLLRPEKYNAIYNRISYILSLKSGITDIFSHNYAKIKLILMILCL